MNDQIENQAIEEMAKVIERTEQIARDMVGALPSPTMYAKVLYWHGYRKQVDGEWEWFEEWNPSTPEHPRECDDCGWRCGECETALDDIVGGYWDNPDEKPNLNFCPNCGAKMKGGAE